MFIVIFHFPFSSVHSCSSSLHLTDEESVDCKEILGKFVLIGCRIVEENHEFCSMEGEHILDEVEGKPAESITMGNHNFRDIPRLVRSNKVLSPGC